MTLRDAQAHARKMGMVIKTTPEGEYRVNYKKGKEATAYYATELDDAVATAEDMAKRANTHTENTMAKRNPYTAVGSAHVIDSVAGAKALWDAWSKNDHGMDFQEYAEKTAPRVFYAMKAFAKGESLRDNPVRKGKKKKKKRTKKASSTKAKRAIAKAKMKVKKAQTSMRRAAVKPISHSRYKALEKKLAKAIAKLKALIKRRG